MPRRVFSKRTSGGTVGIPQPLYRGTLLAGGSAPAALWATRSNDPTKGSKVDLPGPLFPFNPALAPESNPRYAPCRRVLLLEDKRETTRPLTGLFGDFRAAGIRPGRGLFFGRFAK